MGTKLYPSKMRLSALINKYRGKAIYIFLFYAIANKMPGPGFPLGGFGHRIRAYLVEKIFLSCGRDVRISSNVNFCSGVKVSIGNNSNISRYSLLVGDISIGDNVMMGPRISMFTSNHEFGDTSLPMIEQGQGVEKPITVGDDVWIGTQVIVLPGVKIGSHSIIGAGSVVTKDVPEWCVVAGNPARIIKKRK